MTPAGGAVPYGLLRHQGAMLRATATCHNPHTAHTIMAQIQQSARTAAAICSGRGFSTAGASAQLVNAFG